MYILYLKYIALICLLFCESYVRSCQYLEDLRGNIQDHCSCFDLKLDCNEINIAQIKLNERGKLLKTIYLTSVDDLRALSDAFLSPLSGLQHLEELSILNCKDPLTVDPTFLQRFRALTTLTLSKSCLDHFPNVSQKHSLKKLILNGNGIEKIELSTLLNLPQLTHLELNDNNLKQIDPDWIPINSSIRNLYLRGNHLLGLPSSLKYCFGDLEVLDLAGNRFSGQLKISSKTPITDTSRPAPRDPWSSGPDVLQTDTDIYARVRRSWTPNDPSTKCPDQAPLSHLPDWWGQLPILRNLRTLDLSGNCLSHVAQVLLMHFSRLSTLILANNRIIEIGTGAFYKAPAASSQPGPGVNSGGAFVKYDKQRNSMSNLEDNGLNIVDLSGNVGLENISRSWTFGLEQLKTFILSRCGIRRYDKDALHNLVQLRHLDLSHNELKEISVTLFRNLASLDILRLEHNKISHIGYSALTHMPHLRHLNLSGNRLSRLDVHNPNNLSRPEARSSGQISNPNTLNFGQPPAGLPLRSVDQDKMNSRYPPSSRQGMFNKLKQLNVLDLSANNLTSIKNGDFSGLTYLKALNLDGNNLVWIESEAMCVLKNLERLRMDSARFVCDCRLTETLECLALRSIKVEAKCARPTPLSGSPLTSLNVHDLRGPAVPGNTLSSDCTPQRLHSRLETNTKPPPTRLSSFPEISEPPTNPDMMNAQDHSHLLYEASLTSNWLLEGTNLKLTCHVTALIASGRPLVRFERFVRLSGDQRKQWRPEEIAPGRRRTVLLVEPRQINYQSGSGDWLYWSHWYSVMQVQMVTQEDEGRYRCVSKIDVEEEASEILDIKIYRAPVFTVTPDATITISTGKVLPIKCGARGRPIPSTSLRKSTSSHFPAAKSRRLSVNNDDIFFIANVVPEDSGNYTCTSVNVAGAIHSNFQLIVTDSGITKGVPIVLSSDKKPPTSSQAETVTPNEWLSNHWIGVIVIAVVICVVVTSLLWVLALYCLGLRKHLAALPPNPGSVSHPSNSIQQSPSHSNLYLALASSQHNNSPDLLPTLSTGKISIPNGDSDSTGLLLPSPRPFKFDAVDNGSRTPLFKQPRQRGLTRPSTKEGMLLARSMDRLESTVLSNVHSNQQQPILVSNGNLNSATAETSFYRTDREQLPRSASTIFSIPTSVNQQQQNNRLLGCRPSINDVIQYNNRFHGSASNNNNTKSSSSGSSSRYQPHNLSKSSGKLIVSPTSDYNTATSCEEGGSPEEDYGVGLERDGGGESDVYNPLHSMPPMPPRRSHSLISSLSSSCSTAGTNSKSPLPQSPLPCSGKPPRYHHRPPSTQQQWDLSNGRLCSTTSNGTVIPPAPSLMTTSYQGGYHGYKDCCNGEPESVRPLHSPMTPGRVRTSSIYPNKKRLDSVHSSGSGVNANNLSVHNNGLLANRPRLHEPYVNT